MKWASENAAVLATRSEAGAKGGRGRKAFDNINSFGGGTSATYLAARNAADRANNPFQSVPECGSPHE
jgi:hypothetical protein